MKRNTLTVMAVAISLVFAVTVPAMAQTPEPSATPAPAPTQPPMTATTPLFVTSNFLVNVRSGPSIQYTVIGKARSGDAFDITGKLADGTWLRVNFNGQEGWVLASLFDLTGDLTTTDEAVAGANAVMKNASTTTATTGSTTAMSGEVAGMTIGSVNLRSIPSTSGDVIAVIPFNTQLTVTGRVAANNWIQVTYDNHTGWISSGVFYFARGILSNAPVFDASGVAVPATAVPTAKPTAEATTSP